MRFLAALALTISIGLTADLVLSPSAYANDEGSGVLFREDDERHDGAGQAIVFGARQVDSTHLTAGRSRGSSAAGICTYNVELQFDRENYLVHQDVAPHNAVFYWAVCGDARQLRWYVPGDPADPVASGQLTELVQEAFDRIVTSPPTLTLSPGIDRYQLTGMPTFLAIEREAWDEPPSGSVTAGSITVTAWLEPLEVTWDLGTGDTEVCDGPGNTYLEGVAFDDQTIECPYVFTTHPADHFGDEGATHYDISATVTYHANYRVEGWPPGSTTEATLGPIDGPTTTAQQEVRELRPILTTSHD